MKDVELNPLNTHSRNLIRWGVALILILFLIIYLISQNSNKSEVHNDKVHLQNGKLLIFNDSIVINQFPDRIVFHYPYLIVVKPTQQLSSIYNLENKQKEKDIRAIVLDYYNANLLTNSGQRTYYNKKDLGVLCEKGFIKNQNEILCVTKQYENQVINKLISINLQTNGQKVIFASKNIITDVSIIGNDTYFGETHPQTHKNYVYINLERLEVPDIVSLIYQMNEKPYFVSFKSTLNNNNENYYLIENGGTKQLEGAIRLH